MKKNHYFTSFKIFLFTNILIAGLFFGCQQDPIDNQDNLTYEKASFIDKLSFELSSKISTVEQSQTFEGTLPNNALYEIALPETWNFIPDGQRVLMVYAHGYVNPESPISLPNDMISDGLGGLITIKNFLMSSNLGYAATSYRDNGLVVLDAIEDIKELRNAIDVFFEDPNIAAPNALLLVGPSEGGLITVLTIEQNPGLFDAAIATCCPIGNFYKQLQYYGDAHVLFKYFFGPSIKGINMGSPKRISKHTMNAWNTGALQAAIIEILEDDYINNNGHKIMQFLSSANIPVNRSDPVAVVTGILEVLRFPIMATNDAIVRLGGNPYNNKNHETVYEGSDNDRKLNLTVERIKTSDWDIAVQNVANYYETSGFLTTPLVTMHTEFDHVSLFEHQLLYKDKVEVNNMLPFLLNQIKIEGRYGHCNFTVADIMEAINTLLN